MLKISQKHTHHVRNETIQSKSLYSHLMLTLHISPEELDQYGLYNDEVCGIQTPCIMKTTIFSCNQREIIVCCVIHIGVLSLVLSLYHHWLRALFGLFLFFLFRSLCNMHSSYRLLSTTQTNTTWHGTHVEVTITEKSSIKYYTKYSNEIPNLFAPYANGIWFVVFSGRIKAQ